jgi:hypothetical protein
MKCENAQQNIILAQYGELEDDLQLGLEQHLHGCEDCRREWNAILALQQELELTPMVEPSPNLLAASRMRLDEALDALPPRSFSQRFWGNTFRWVGFVQGAPALATLLLGVGFLSGNLLVRYEVAHAPRDTGPVTVYSPARGAITSVSGIVRTPNSKIVEVQYSRLVPESIQGSLDDPQIREMLMQGAKLATTSQVHEMSVAALADECARDCDSAADVRQTLLASLRYDKSPVVRLKALTALERYVSQDQHVRDAVLDSLMHDRSEDVRSEAISVLMPVQGDSSVRQVLRTVSTQDVNPAIRNASYQVLQGTADIQ